ncbi:hypothetical protein Q0Z83_042860 [Actinoplanes sichuanensis]|uniref:WXG100 family type VII secretion target n=1 Tax=Actinoplanes sichuanensis TaxID=512349 RepID=A0ABW4AT06_9ACTN|nr:WXG100 family type VII secretion target [Actinoplanes sichuanensis]BEL06095.1 hypothetical protein Q0Z83_042860 [Actinoplanes sichuanensis]
MGFSDPQDPTAYLTAPAERSESIWGQPFSNPGTVFDWFSPTHIINEFIKQACGYDPVGDAAKVFGGDWETIWQAAGAIANLADALQAIGINLTSGNLDLDAQWEGNASEAAYVYFMQLGSTLSSQHESLTDLADSYLKAAEGAYRLAESASGVIKDMGDAAIMGVIATSAGTAAIETGVGAVAGYSYAAYQAWKIYELGAKLKLIISTAYNAINLLTGEIQAASADTGALSRYPLPAAYQHPANAAPL